MRLIAFQKIKALSTLLSPLLLIFLGACGKVNLEWMEQVQLSDAREITVKRTATGKKFNEIGGPGGWATHEMTVEFASPEIKDPPAIWRARWVPMVLDRDPATREWFIVATLYTCTDWYDLGRPKLPYVEYRFRSGIWKQVELSPSVIGLKANLLTGPKANGEAQLVTLAHKTSRDLLAAPEYKRVVPIWQTTC